MPAKPAPTKRLRWATQRLSPAEGRRKRNTIIRALSRHKMEKDDSRPQSSGQLSNLGGDRPPSMLGEEQPRRIFFNTPLPSELLDEDGAPIQQFSRNKIRTAKYTPLIFIPKNLWLQFHNIANVYFLFVTILAVGSCVNMSLLPFANVCFRFFLSLVLPTLNLDLYL